MTRWAIATLVVMLGVAGGGGIWRTYEVGKELDEASDRVTQLQAADGAASELLEEASIELARKDKRLASLLEDLKSARRSLRQGQRVADSNFCFNDRVGLEPGFLRGPLRADVDGDGSSDRVYALGRRLGLRGTCNFFLVVKTDSSTYRARVRHGELDVNRFSLPTYFNPESAAQLDTRPGNELLIGVHQGAAVVFGAIYTISDGALVRLDVSDQGNDTLGYEGSLCCGGAVNCEGDSIVYSKYGQRTNASGYVVTRRFYDVAGSSLMKTNEESARVADGNLDRFREFRGRALSHCPGYIQAMPR